MLKIFTNSSPGLWDKGIVPCHTPLSGLAEYLHFFYKDLLTIPYPIYWNKLRYNKYDLYTNLATYENAMPHYTFKRLSYRSCCKTSRSLDISCSSALA